jgi:hypothetical protein
MKQFFLGLLVGIMCGVLGYYSFHKCVICELPHVPEDTTIVLEQPEFFLSDTITVEGLYKACEYYEIQQPDIVVAQAILETGFFKSDLCLKRHNLFGLFNSRTMDFYSFDHWTESVKAYRDKVQYRYKTGNYYDWLERIGYAEDSLYVSKLKNVRINYNLGVE